MNWRALGCIGLAAVVFVLVGILGLSRALTPTACPPAFEVPSGRYMPIGEATSTPRLPDSDDTLEPAGELGLGAAWELWLRPGEAPAASGEELPPQLVLECGDGTYQGYERDDT